ncbi:NAD(P)-dependent alcohol dehydrogenase [Knoellia sp. S7-12]|uniref:NAD(P)-dependent alcohol dehydrogenase n=1 Tax=Knoellia sp. S7-12 TaxID=3126698 RepID=UPI0033672F29
MPTTTSALSVPSAGAPFEAVEIERRDLRDDDVRIDVAFAGICHSDIHTVRDEWGPAHYPIITGHEVAGTVSAVGSAVTKHKVGDRVGVGCLVDSCAECENCKNSQEQFCTKGSVGTYNAQNYDGEWAAGGYSQQIVVTERMVVRIPEGLELDEAAPLLCAGITTYSPLKRWGSGTGRKVAVVGVGGLGHMGVKIAKAMGAEVSTLSRSSAKAEDAKGLGSSNHIATSDTDAMKAARGSFDLILNTVSADLDMETYLKLLRPNGALVNVGIPESPYSVGAFNLIGGNKVLTGSNIGGIAETQEMLDFCAEHGIGATIETIDASDTATVDAAYERVVAGDVRYRVVIDTSTISPSA